MIIRATCLMIGLIASLSISCHEPPSRVSPQGGSSTASPPAASQPQLPSSGTVHFEAQDGWITETASSSMRVAQYKLARVEGDSEDAELVVFYFGPGGAGTIQANLDRWIGQMQQPDGSPSSERARTEKTTVNGLTVTQLDLTGVFTAEMTPGAGVRHNKPNSRMRAGVVETPRGAYFVKLVGPLNTVDRWNDSFEAFIRSFEFK